MKRLIILVLFFNAALFSLRISTLKNNSSFDVNVRETPNASAKIIDKISTNEEVVVTKTYNKWVAITYNDNLAYTYRESLNCSALNIYPFRFNIPCNLSYKYTPEILFKDYYKFYNYKIPDYIISILLLFLALLLSLQKKSKVIKSKSSHSKLYNNTARSNVYHQELRANEFKDVAETPAYISNINHKTPEEKGAAFENYIVQKISKKHFSFLEWASDKITNCGRYAESNKNPDLKFKHRSSGIEFYIECKYRSSDNIVIEDFQLTRYKKFGAINKVNVFVVIGTEGTPESPKNLYLIPTYVIKNSDSINNIKEKYRKKNINKMFYFDSKFKTLR